MKDEKSGNEAEGTERNIGYLARDTVSSSAMTGLGDNYISAISVKLGADNAFVGSLSAVPQFCSAAAQLFSIRAMKLFGRKRTVVLCALAQSISWLAMGLLVFLLPAESLGWIMALYTAGTVFGAVLVGPWTSWATDVVPEERRISFFARRNKIIAVASLAAIISAGAILELNPPGKTIAFALVFLLAGACRLASSGFLSRVGEPTGESPAQEIMPWTMMSSRNKVFRNFLACSFLIYLAVMVSSPFFVVYMLNTLHFSYLQFTAVLVFTTIAKIVAAEYWPDQIERHGTKAVLFSASILVAAKPFLWAATTDFTAIVMIEMLTGFGWMGMELAFINYIVDASSKENRASLTANYNMFVSFARLLGAAAGVVLISFFADKSLLWFAGFSLFLVAAGVIRLAAVLLMFPRIGEVSRKPEQGWPILARIATVDATTQVAGIIGKRIKSGSRKAREMEKKLMQKGRAGAAAVAVKIREGAEKAKARRRDLAKKIGKGVGKAVKKMSRRGIIEGAEKAEKLPERGKAN